MLENSFLIDTRMKKIDTTVPATPLLDPYQKLNFVWDQGTLLVNLFGLIYQTGIFLSFWSD